MSKQLGFFDVDTREPDTERGEGLRFRERVDHIKDKLENLLDYADQHKIPVVACACVNAGLTAECLPSNAVFVPETPWDGELEGYQTIFLEKKTCGSVKANIQERAFDVFCANPNTFKVLDSLGIRDWVVFGTSVEFCIQSTIEGLLRQGLTVTILDDVLALGPGGEKAAAKALAALRTQGAKTMSFDQFFSECVE